MNKKFYLLMPFAALALASCSNEESAQNSQLAESPVGFRTLVGVQTRGDVSTATTLGSFKVQSEDPDGGIRGTGTNYATANPFTWEEYRDLDGDGISWTQPEFKYHYWNKDNATAIVKFTAFGPSDANFTSLPTSRTALGETTDVAYDGVTAWQAEYTVPKTVADQKDLVVAYSEATQQSNSVSGVPLNFKHVLSQIVIRATNKNTQERKVEVIGVKLVNALSKATLRFPYTSTGSDSFQWGEAHVQASAWGTATTLVDYGMSRSTDPSAADKADIVTLTEAAKDITFAETNGTAMFLMPQQLTAWDSENDNTNSNDGAYIGVLCRIYDLTDANNKQIWPVVDAFTANGTQVAAGTNTNKFAYVAIPIGTEWEVGKKYVYTLNFYQGAGGAGLVAPDQVDPDDKGHDIADPPTGKDPGKEVDDTHSEAIFFTVTVSDWDDANAQNLVMQ